MWSTAKDYPIFKSDSYKNSIPQIVHQGVIQKAMYARDLPGEREGRKIKTSYRSKKDIVLFLSYSRDCAITKIDGISDDELCLPKENLESILETFRIEAIEELEGMHVAVMHQFQKPIAIKKIYHQKSKRKENGTT